MTYTSIERSINATNARVRRKQEAAEAGYPIIFNSGAGFPEFGTLPERYTIKREGKQTVKLCPLGYAVGAEPYLGWLRELL